MSFTQSSSEGEEFRIPLSEAQAITESLVGAVKWNGAEGTMMCPGSGLHTTGGGSSDCKVVCEPVFTAGGRLAPGIYCFHQSCSGVVDAVSRALRSALGRRCFKLNPVSPICRVLLRLPEPVFDPSKLERIARRLNGVDPEYFAARSKICVDDLAPDAFLRELYRPGEKVVVFDDYESQGQAIWTCEEPHFDKQKLERFRVSKRRGVWFLANPVTGQFVLNDNGKQSRRSRQNVTAFRYLVVESDSANPEHWLSLLAQLPTHIAAIYTSGGKSIHALFVMDAESKEAWDHLAMQIKPALITIGADPKAMTAVRLTRLPFCERVEKGQVQRLLYLNGSPDGTPICEQKVRR